MFGKKELQKKRADFAVTIAEIQNNRPVNGGIFVPAQNLLFLATSENKAYRIAPAKNDKAANISELLLDKNLLSRPIRGFFVNILKDRAKMNRKSEIFLENFKAHYSGSIKEIVYDSPLRLLKIAEGSCDLYPHLRSTPQYEIAAFDALIFAAGYMVTKKDGIVPLQYNLQKLKFPGYLAKTNFELDSVDLS